ALGECLTIEKRYNEAEPLLLESYESLKSSQGANNPRTQLALQRLITLYENWGKLDRARAYRENLSKR
ncbi:MAG: tetratricopeptide repeat protein, partial [Acidobacteria bacterium]